ncbi:MAG: nucleoside deaminase [Alphaproteobacteria bacterium]|nr:nucleoside deaminase [Alphaproteobacteria bacterium]
MERVDYMYKALELAKKAYQQDEVPIGCIIVNSKSGEIIAEAYNLCQHVENAVSHAEIKAIQTACDKLGTNRLWGMDMYVTLEPCTMCAAAISFARIENLYFGATDTKGGAVVSGVRFFEQETCHHRPFVCGGILENECAQLLKDFFKNKRNTKGLGN